MKHFLLLGAGFSRNWGGWLANEAFEYLLGCDQIRQNEKLKNLLWQHKDKGGFESALAELQAAWAQELEASKLVPLHHSEVLEQLTKLQSALEGMFQDMNNAFQKLNRLDFEDGFLLTKFLKNFDGIFTLNQDLLFEKQYKTGLNFFDMAPKFTGWDIPGMREATYHSGYDAATSKWVPLQPHEFKVAEGKQPYYKLHGSANWRDGGNNDLMILGGKKDDAILSHEILKWYYREFWNELTREPARLMVIGYSFRDDHINKAILNAVEKGLEVFIIDPAGVDVLITNDAAKIRSAVIGASRRTLREIFSDRTNPEYHKVMRFFS
jgi:hypothetical protein